MNSNNVLVFCKIVKLSVSAPYFAPAPNYVALNINEMRSKNAREECANKNNDASI